MECVICGKVFEGRSNKTICSVECYKEKIRRKGREWRKKNPDKQYTATKRWLGLHPEKQADRCRKYRREIAALSWAINKGTGKT